MANARISPGIFKGSQSLDGNPASAALPPNFLLQPRGCSKTFVLLQRIMENDERASPAGYGGYDARKAFGESLS
jgi:hypothetical protein